MYLINSGNLYVCVLTAALNPEKQYVHLRHDICALVFPSPFEAHL